MKPSLARTAVAAIAAIAAAALTLPPPAAAHDRDHEALYVPPPGRDAVSQIAQLAAAGRWRDALLVGKMVSTPSAVWFEGGSPDGVRREVSRTVRRAAAKRTVPVLVTYNIPYRDCSQYSAGGAAGTEEYKAWIDGFAAGLGDRKAIVILEPDSLGIIPYYTPLGSTTMEWCQPTGGSAALAAARFEELNHAVDRLAEHPNVQVYLDGTHSGWLGVGDLTDRLLKAGVQRTQGFYLNVSNYRETSHLLKYGTWTSKCIYLSTNSWWQPQWCASQYYPANPNDFSTWVLSDQAYDQAFADTGLTWGGADARHFVIDTSRNGRGPWTPPADHPPGDPQDWCNPPDRGLGLRPTLRTGQPLADANLWVKTPGESDGQCTRWGPGPEDPVRGMVDPPAGAWFPEQALELARLAVPPLRPWFWDD